MSYSMKQFTSLAPELYAGLGAVAKSIDASGLEKPLTELVKLRASQLNGCLYCLQFHLNAGRKAGLSQGQLDQLAAWRESAAFDERQRAALAWTEALTLTATTHEEREQALAGLDTAFDFEERYFLTACIGLINAWNRIAGGLAFPPPPGDLAEGASHA
jgi:AhpD family alkylhydroperoxidase